ncbi:hypothetical protein EBZ37_02755 [bacterium]|nr:hypothetical protein [bacterium]
MKAGDLVVWDGPASGSPFTYLLLERLSDIPDTSMGLMRRWRALSCMGRFEVVFEEHMRLYSESR